VVRGGEKRKGERGGSEWKFRGNGRLGFGGDKRGISISYGYISIGYNRMRFGIISIFSGGMWYLMEM